MKRIKKHTYDRLPDKIKGQEGNQHLLYADRKTLVEGKDFYFTETEPSTSVIPCRSCGEYTVNHSRGLCHRCVELNRLVGQDVYKYDMLHAVGIQRTQERADKSFRDTYPVNLFCDLFRHSYSASEYPFGPENEAGLEYILDTFFKPRDRDIIKARYRDKMTLEQIGQMYEVSRESIRQVIKRDLAKIRSKYLPYIQHGPDAKERRDAAVDQVLTKNGAIDAPTFTPEPSPDPIQALSCTTIYDIGLSPRSINCLEGAGIVSFFDLCNVLKAGKLTNYPNFGVTCLNEVSGQVISTLVSALLDKKNAAKEVPSF